VGGCKQTTIVFFGDNESDDFFGRTNHFFGKKHRRVVTKKLFDVARTFAREHFTKPIQHQHTSLFFPSRFWWKNNTHQPPISHTIPVPAVFFSIPSTAQPESSP